MSFANISSNPNTFDFNTYLEVGSFEYIPRKFLNINTSTFGDSRKKINSFLQLKEAILNINTSFEDKCQGIRYMCHIPYRNALEHIMECCKHVISNDEYDLDKRFYFFANNEKYFKLDDHVVFHSYPFFFNLCLERNYPYYFTILSSKYIIQTIPDKELIDKAKKFLYSIGKDVNETIENRADALDTLLEYGNLQDKEFAKEQLESLGDTYVENLKSNIYTNIQNIHNESIQQSIRNMLRNLIQTDKKIKLEKEYHMEDIHQFLIQYYQNPEPYLEVLNRLLTDPSKYEGRNLGDILILVWRRIHSFEIDYKETLLKRFIEEFEDMKNTCSTGHLSRILNILSGFVKDEDYQLKISPNDSLRSSIFARLNTELRKMGGSQQEELLNALASSNKEDKQVLLEYLQIYNPKDELYKEYVTSNLMLEEEFNLVYEKTIEEYIG